MQRSTFRLRGSLPTAGAFVLLGALACASQSDPPASSAPRPNVLVVIADDWSHPHASVYGDRVVKTPAFDRLAREGVLFRHAFASAPSCTPSRAALLAGQAFWRLDGAANLYGVFPDRVATYPELLARAGYVTGAAGRLSGPGSTETPGRELEGPLSPSFRAFLAGRAEDRPFCFWLGGFDPHRQYDWRSGERSGIDVGAIELPPFLPEARAIRRDLADYYLAIQRFDALVADALAALDEAGQLENTLIVVTSDNGMPFPRCKSNVYDLGVRVPLAVRWGTRVGAGRVIEDFVSLADLAPTFLELAGVSIPAEMTGRSLAGVLTSARSGQVDPARDHALVGKERHVPAQEAPDMGGYPMRAMRTREFLYVRNYRPDRWPSGTPDHERAAIPELWLAEADNSPTKVYVSEGRAQDEAHARAYELCFAKRPAEELYDLRADPGQLRNLAGDPALAGVKAELAARLEAELTAAGDPRMRGEGERFDRYPYTGSGPRHYSLLEGKKEPEKEAEDQ